MRYINVTDTGYSPGVVVGSAKKTNKTGVFRLN
jgi:hypothetical protein